MSHGLGISKNVVIVANVNDVAKILSIQNVW